MEQAAEEVAKEGGGEGEGDVEAQTECLAAEKGMNRKEKRKAMKKMKRKQTRKEMALKEREDEEAILNDPQQLMKIRIMEQEEAERSERERKMFEERERAWIQAMEKKRIQEEEEEERRIKALEEEEEELSRKQQVENGDEGNEDDDWEYVEEGPAEIIWQGNEITVKKKRVKVPKRSTDQQTRKEDSVRPTSNPLPPQSEAFADYKTSSMSAQQLIDNVAEQVPHFGTEQDKAHCPFHLKTGACRFGQRCSRVHFYPDKSSTLLIKNMYSGPGLAWEQDEVLEHTDEEVERCYEEFYEDVHTEFLKFGEIINFKVCRNGSFHLRGNVYIHYKALDSAVLAHQSINGRYFAGKQISCDFINVTRWKVAICGEYMKSRYKTCSHGTACNFIHCFHNPGGDYEWADSDRPPPKYWVRKMVALFGYSDADEKQMAEENFGLPRNSTKMTMAHSERYGLRRSRSRERDYLRFTASGRRYEDEQNKNFKYHQRKSRKCDTESEDVELLDREMDGDRHHDHTRRSSKRRIRDHKNKTHETESEEDLSDGENKNDEVDRDWSDRDTAGDAYHENRRRSGHKRKVGCPDNHKDSKNRARDADGQWSDSNRRGDKHHSRRKSSGQITKASKFSNYGNRTTRSCSTESSDDFLDNDAERHPHRAGKQSKRLVEVSDISDDDLVPAQNFKHRHDHLSIEMGEADPFVKSLKSDGTHESSSLGQAAERCRSHDFDTSCVSDVHTDKVERWEPEPASVSKIKAGGSESYESGRPGRYNGRDESNDFHSELYYHNKVREDGYESDKATHSKHRKSRRKSANSDRKLDSENRSRGSSQSSHRRHSSSVEEATDATEDNKDSGRKHEKHHAGHRSRDHKRHHTSRKLAT